MIGIDTNVLLRLFVEDESDQTKQAAKLLDASRDRSETLFVTDIVLFEMVWVL